MSAFIQQLPALIGVVIGALGSYPAVVRSLLLGEAPRSTPQAE
ncbi:hypothetical protein [Streptomyces sp. 4N124]